MYAVGAVVAVRIDHLQGVRDHQGHIDRRDRVHVNCPERRPVLRHRGPDAQAARVRGRPPGYQVYRHRGRDHMVPGGGVRRARGHQLVRQAVPAEQRDAVRGVLPLRRGTGAHLSAAGRRHPVSGLLRGAPVRHCVFLRHDGPTPDSQHQEHARRSPGE